MAYRKITAAEGAAMINDGENIGFSGFTPNGVPKAVIRELSKRAIAEHDAGKPFKVGILTGASSCQSLEGDFANANAIKFRAPFSTNADFRRHANLGEIDYEDMHLGHMAERLRRGFYGDIDWAIIEVSAIEDAGDKLRIFLTSADGIVPTIVRLAKRVILELNTFHDPRVRYLHDEYECAEYPYRQPIPLLTVGGRIGKEYLELDPSKLVGVVECCIPEEARSFKAVTPETEAIGNHVVDFFLNDIKKGHIPPSMFPIQSELSNSAELIHRFGVIAMNTALECDIYGNENSSHVCGSKLMNGIGGSCDYERNGSISIFYTPSTAKNGCISAIVPQCCHIDSTEHDVDVIITEQGIADLRGKGPARRAEEIIENCAHPDYRPLLREYQRIASKGHEPCALRAAFAFHDTLVNKGDMRLTDFGEYM